MLLTFVIPTSPEHEAIAERAIASCLAQAILCRVVVVYDRDRQGAGATRNRGLECVETPFCSFLDADDWLEPTFAEECLRAWDGRHYVYTDHFWGDTPEVEQMSDYAWDGTGAWHVVTTLLPTAFVRHVGGFDETLPGFEDTDFYWKLTRAGLWGRRLPKALFHYGSGGQRAQAFRDHPDRDRITQRVLERYKGFPMSEDCNGCGGSGSTVVSGSAGEPQLGDVLAQTLWRGNRSERGRRTGRIYRGGWGKQIWMSPADIDASPHLFARMVELPPKLDEAALAQFRAVARQVMRTVDAPTPPDSPLMPVPAGTPDVERVLRLYAGTREANSPGG